MLPSIYVQICPARFRATVSACCSLHPANRGRLAPHLSAWIHNTHWCPPGLGWCSSHMIYCSFRCQSLCHRASSGMKHPFRPESQPVSLLACSLEAELSSSNRERWKPWPLVLTRAYLVMSLSPQLRTLMKPTTRRHRAPRQLSSTHCRCLSTFSAAKPTRCAKASKSLLP